MTWYEDQLEGGAELFFPVFPFLLPSMHVKHTWSKVKNTLS